MDMSKLMSQVKSKKKAIKTKDRTIKPSPGSNRYVLLPGWRAEERHVFWHEFGQHYVKNAAGEIQAVYVCTDKTFGVPCPVCEGLAKATRMTTDDETVELLKQASSGQSYLMNVLALDSEDDASPQILEVRKSVYGQILDLIEEWAPQIFDGATPQIITVNREGKGINTKYSVQISPKRHTLPKGVLTKLHNLDEYVAQENEEGQRKALMAINAAAGLLPAPATADAPRLARSKPAPVGDVDPTIEIGERGRETVVSGGAGGEVMIDSELDDLLGDLTGTDN